MPDTMMGRQAAHNMQHASTIGFSCFMLFLVLVLSGCAYGGVPGMFTNSTTDTLEMNSYEMTPQTWVFITNPSIYYCTMAAFLIYSITTIFRQIDGTYIYRSEYGVPIQVYACVIALYCCEICWVFNWNNDYDGHVWVSWVFTVLMLAAAYAAEYLTIRDEKAKLSAQQCSKMGLRLALVNSALHVSSIWVTLLCIYTFGAALTTSGAMNAADSATFMLVVLIVAMLIWFCFELTICYKHFYQTHLHFTIILLLGVGIISNLRDMSNRNSILAIVVVIVNGLFQIAKGIKGCYIAKKCKKSPSDSKCELANNQVDAEDGFRQK